MSELEKLDGVLDVPMFYGTGRGAVRLAHLPGSDVPIYFIEHNGYFDRPHVYGGPSAVVPVDQSHCRLYTASISVPAELFGDSGPVIVTEN